MQIYFNNSLIFFISSSENLIRQSFFSLLWNFARAEWGNIFGHNDLASHPLLILLGISICIYANIGKHIE